MNNREILFVRVDVCRRCLQDFFEFLVESSCPDSNVFAFVTESLYDMQKLQKYVESLSVSSSK